MYRFNPFVKKKGKQQLSSDYRAYLSYILKMTPDERREWENLGVHITQARERRLTCLGEICDFIEKPLSGEL